MPDDLTKAQTSEAIDELQKEKGRGRLSAGSRRRSERSRLSAQVAPDDAWRRTPSPRSLARANLSKSHSEPSCTWTTLLGSRACWRSPKSSDPALRHLRFHASVEDLVVHGSIMVNMQAT